MLFNGEEPREKRVGMNGMNEETLTFTALFFLRVTALAPEGGSTLNRKGDLGMSTPLKVTWRRWGPVSRGLTAISTAPEMAGEG